MTESRKSTAPALDERDDAPDLSSPEWQAKFAGAKRVRGAQKAPTKAMVTIRLDRDVIEHFKAGGEGWQSRINEALRRTL